MVPRLSKIGIVLLFFISCCGTLGSAVKKPPPPPPGKPNQVALTFYVRGSYLLEHGNPVEAERALKQALAADPNSPKIKAKLAEVYLLQDRTNEARRLAVEVLPYYKNDPYFLIMIGRIEVSRGDFESARKHLEHAAQLDPTNDEILMLMWRVEAETGRFDEAARVLETLAAKYPGVAEIHFWLGLVKEASAKHAEAQAEFEKAVEFDPHHIPSLLKLGACALRSGDKAAAERYFRRVLDLDPRNIEALEGMAAVKGKEYSGPVPGSIDELGLRVAIDLIDKGKFDEAIRELDRLLAKRPGNTVIVFFLAMAYEGGENLTKALELYESMPPESSIYPQARFRRALTLARMKRYDEALAAAEKLYSNHHGMSDVALLLAGLYMEREEYSRAVEILEPVAKADPLEVTILLTLGVAHYEAGNENKGLRIMRRVLEINPNNAEALNFIGYSYAEQGVKLDEAEKLILEALKLKPDSAAITDSLGWVYFKQGKISKAIKLLEKAHKMDPDEPEITEHLGDAYAKVGKKKKAVELYRKALASNPKSDRARRLKKKISTIEKP